MKIELLIKNYFSAWSKKDINKLESMFSDNVVLIDWDISVNGKNNVLKTNKDLFSSVKKIDLQIVNLCYNESVAIAELNITIDGQILNVVDIIELEAGLIKEIRAFKR
jgi:ketosteroid isomerase-like protein